MANQVLLFLQDLTISDTQVFTGDKTVGFIRVTDTGNFTVSKGSTLICNGLDVQGNGVFNIESGGVFVVMKYGITTEKCENFVFNRGLEDSAELYMNPEISSNNNPLGRLMMPINAGKSSAQVWSRTGMCVNNLSQCKRYTSVSTQIVYWIAATESWQTVANVKTMIPWVEYSFSWKEALQTVLYHFDGNFCCNANSTISVPGSSQWLNTTNSYPGKIYIPEFIALLPNTIDSIMVQVADNTQNYTFNKSNSDNCFLSPCHQSIMFKNPGDAFSLILSYKDLVWDPFWKKRRGELQETTVYSTNMPVTLEARNNILMNSEVLNEPVIEFE